jgi:hypothetical protein
VPINDVNITYSLIVGGCDGDFGATANGAIADFAIYNETARASRPFRALLTFLLLTLPRTHVVVHCSCPPRRS